MMVRTISIFTTFFTFLLLSVGLAQDGDLFVVVAGGRDWKVVGNAGTTPGTNFLGTTDEQALELKVNSQRVLRLEPNATSPNVIAGNSSNNVAGGVYGATISGGGGGSSNSNQVSNNYATVGGGYHNIVSGSNATIGGGHYNSASETDATISGGYRNIASKSYATVGGGYYNTASGDYAMVCGGQSNTAAGKFSFAAGRGAIANSQGSFVWADSYGFGSVTCDTPNRWKARASGGVYFYTDTALSSGSYLASGGSSWNAVSNRSRKENFASVDTNELLAQIASIEIGTWNYKTQDPSIRHVGPMADDFNALIPGLGGEGKDYVNSLDADGIALAAIQGLYKKLSAKDRKIREQELHTQNLEERIARLEVLMASYLE